MKTIRHILPALLLVLALPASALAQHGGGGSTAPAPTTTTPTISSVTFAPSSVGGGGSATGTVTFSSVPDGAVIHYVSSDPSVAQVPEQTVIGRVQSGRFPVQTSPVAETATVTITATAYGFSRSATLTVTPGTAPAADTVRITRAEISAGLLRIEATSSNPLAILTAHIGSTALVLTNDGGGHYSLQRFWDGTPPTITVTSSFGGSATAPVVFK